MHLKRHHRKYLFGAIGGFALVKMFLLLFGLTPITNVGNTFANNPVYSQLTNPLSICSHTIRSGSEEDENAIYNFYCTGKNIGSIITGAFSGYEIHELDLSYNHLSTLDFEVFTGVSGMNIYKLDLLYNQIYDTKNENMLEIHFLNRDHNCLASEEIGSSNNIDNQDVCFYVEYTPDSLTNNPAVSARLVFTGNINMVNNLGSIQDDTKLFSQNDLSYFDVSSFENNSGDIRNYPEGGQFPSEVSWIDTDPPICGNVWSPSSAFNQGRLNNEVTVTLETSTDVGVALIAVGGGDCILLEKKDSSCSVEISDNAGNTGECRSPLVNVDTHRPTITLDKESGETSSSHTVQVTISDNIAGFEINQSVWYRWQTDEICSDNISEYHSKALENSAGITGAIAMISTEGLENGEYYLCIMSGSIRDLAGNASELLKSEGKFIIEGHSAPPEPIVTGGLVGFGENTVFSNWKSDEDIVDIIRYLGSEGAWGYSSQNISGLEYDPELDNIVTSGGITVNIETEAHNQEYICAFAQTGQYIQTICSDNVIRIDRTMPTITLGVVNNAVSGDTVILSWNGSDTPSGIDKYYLTVNGPHNTYHYEFNSGTTNKSITVNKSGTWDWSVEVCDRVMKCSTKSSSFIVTSSDPTPPEPPTPGENTGILIQIAEQPYNGWTSNTRIIFWLTGGATGGWKFSNTNNTGQFDCLDGCSPIPSSLIINISDVIDGEYICAIAYKGENSQKICSDNKIFVDPLYPQIELLNPDNGTNFESGDEVILGWSGHDNGPSGISGYTLVITRPDNTSLTRYFNPWVNSTGIILNQSGTWNRSVKITDRAGNSAQKGGRFIVQGSGSGGGSGYVEKTGFYLITPSLFEEIELGTDVIFKWNTGSANHKYIWNVEKIGGDIVSGGTTADNHVELTNGYFEAGAYSRSVGDSGDDKVVSKAIPLFYIIDTNDKPDLKINQFEFNEIEDAEINEYYTSNRITIDGLEDDWYTFAYLEDGKGVLYVNGDFVGTEGIVTNGDKIRIELKAGSGYNSTITAKLIVGTGNNLVSGDFKVTTKGGITGRDDTNLTTFQRLRGVIYIDSLVEMYQYDEEKLATFLSTFMQLLQDKSDFYAQKIAEAEADGDDELVTKYKTYKNAVDFLYTLVKYRYDNIELEDRTVYIAPNGKQYLVEYDEYRRAYTSPDFVKPKYFPSWALFTNHIDMNNPAKGKWGIVGNVITTHNGKVYTIYETNGKWTSSDFKTKKYFDTKEDIINHILANNPASDWNHTIDTSFDEVKYTAPNGKVYKIFKTSSKGNNPEMYSSYNFVNAKYFTSLEAAKKFIDQNNKK